MFNYNLEDRVKRLEEELCYCHKDLANLINLVENLEPEIHYHTYLDMRSCKENDQTKSHDINDFI
jgi:hypothetical protein